jgi:protein-S-isoprenylcysteine O-methyltransferase Ste14
MTDAPAFRIPPLALGIGCAAAMWLLAERVPGVTLHWPVLRPAGALLAALGAGVGATGVLAFRRARTSVNPLQPSAARALVKDGLYARTRNPMYLGIALVLLGWAAWLSNPLTLLLLLPCLAYLELVQIPAEERALRQIFGEEFEDYRRDTPRWW